MVYSVKWHVKRNSVVLFQWAQYYGVRWTWRRILHWLTYDTCTEYWLDQKILKDASIDVIRSGYFVYDCISNWSSSYSILPGQETPAASPLGSGSGCCFRDPTTKTKSPTSCRICGLTIALVKVNVYFVSESQVVKIKVLVSWRLHELQLILTNWRAYEEWNTYIFDRTLDINYAQQRLLQRPNALYLQNKKNHRAEPWNYFSTVLQPPSAHTSHFHVPWLCTE